MKLSRAGFAFLAVLVFTCCVPVLAPAAVWSQQAAQQAAPPTAPAADLQSKAPAIVFLIRHAEKPMEDKDPHLAPQGFKRAQALPALFLQQKGSTALPRLPRPAALFATATAKHSDRPMETITPLSQALHLTINHSFEDRETTADANEILSGKYAGKVVLICWHHGEIPHLAKALGAETPKKWDDTVFDQIWMMEWVDGKVQFSTLPERLLPGDSAK
jgi:hypothetical protein